MHYAAEQPYPGLLTSLASKMDVRIRDPQGYSPIHYAAQAGHVKNLQILLARYARLVDLETLDGATPLYVAVQNKQDEAVFYLLSRGANPNCKMAQGMSALMCAIHRRPVAIAVKLALHPRLDLNDCLDDQTTPLQLAVEVEKMFKGRRLCRLLES